VRVKRVCAGIAAGFLLLVLVLPQPALADPALISLSEASGHCGETIEGTATVDLAGTYRICWNSRTSSSVKDTFTATGAGNHTIEFIIPETVKGTYTVYLTTGEDYSQVATSSFTVVPFVEISRDGGPVATEVKFNGCGFAASQDVRVSFLGEATAGKADTVGSWTLNDTIPATPAGSYTFDVEYKEGDVWYKLGGKNFEVTPEITAPSSGTVGKTIQVEGTGFASEEKNIKVLFRQGTTADVVARENISADEDGSWEATVVVPTVRGGSYDIDASGPSTKASDVPEVSFTLGAAVLVDPGSAYVGDTITVTGGGFASGEPGIRVTFDGQVVASGITARANGSWQYPLVLTATTYGPHTISASGDETTSAAAATLTIGATIEPPSPGQGAPGDSVSLTGSGFSGSQRLTVTIGGVAATENMQTLPNGNVVVNFKVPKGSIQGRQPLTASAGGATAQDYFTVTERILPTPQPISPRDGTRLRSGEVTFQWGATTGSNNITYTLQISNSPDVATYVRSFSGLPTSSYRVPEEDPLDKDTYYWWVKAVDDYGNESPWSVSSSFNVSPIPTWVWVVIGVVILIVLMVVAYRETKFRVTE
jgi:hypothetical protein